MGSQIMAQLDLDEARFSAGLSRAEKRFEMFGEKVNSMNFDRGAKNFNKVFGPGNEGGGGHGGLTQDAERTLHRGFGPGEMLKAGMKGLLGFATIDTAIEAVKKHYEHIAEIAKEIARDNERGTAALERVKDLFRSDPQKLSNLREKFKEDMGKFREANSPAVNGLDSPEDAQKAAKLAAGLRENLEKQAMLRKAIATQRAEDAKRAGDIEKQADNEREHRAVDAMDLQEKLFHFKLAELNAVKAAQLASDPVAKATAHLAVEKALTDQKNTQGEIDKQAIADQEKLMADVAERDAAEERAGKDAEARRQRELTARFALGKAETNLADARAARTQFTLGDAVSGKRGTRTEQIEARRIQDLEERAKRVRDMGGQVGDENGNFMDANTRGQQLMDRAAKLREDLKGKLTKEDSDPMAALKQAVEDSKAVLEQIRDNLEPQ